MRNNLKVLRLCTLVTTLTGLFGFSFVAVATVPDLIRPERLAPYGLELAWFNQVQMDRGRGRVTEWLLDRGTLFVVTDTAVIQAFDAETGQSLWSTVVGSPDLLTLKPTAGEHLVALVNGSTIYILNRHNGVILWKRQTEGAVGAGPVLSPSRVYVPLIRGKIESYAYEWETPQIAVTRTPSPTRPTESQTPAAEPAAPSAPPQQETTTQREPGAGTTEAEAIPVAVEPISQEQLRLSLRQRPGLFVMSWGRALVEPRLTYADSSRERVAWPTDRGLLFVAEADVRADLRFQIQYFLQTNGDIIAPPCVRPGDPTTPNDPNRMLFVATTNGFVHALREHDGKLLWRFSTAEPINQSPALIKDDLYFTTQVGGLYRVRATDGQLIWFSRDIRQFVAASDERVYACDDLNRLVILDIQTGARLGHIDIAQYPLRYMNSDTDRIYLADQAGLIMCLRESRLPKPIQHVVPIVAPSKPKPQPQPAQAEPQPPPQAPPSQLPGENPFQ